MEVQAFRAQFLEAARQHDYQAVRQLVEYTNTSLPISPLLKQWHDYAMAYLALMEQQRPDKAITWLEPLYLQLGGLISELQGRVLNALGIAYETNGQWDKALQLFQTCLDFYEEQGNPLRQGITLSNMANVYCKGMSYVDAISAARRAIYLLEHNQSDREWQINLGGAWNVLGIAQTEEELLSEAEISLKTCLAIWIQWEDGWGQGIAYHNLGRVYQQQEQYEQAIIHYQLARDKLTTMGDLRQASNTISRLGQVKIKMGTDFIEAQQLLNEALHLAQLTHNHENITNIHLRRAELYEHLEDTKAALNETRLAVSTVEDLRANIALTETRIRLQGSRIEAYEKMVMRLNHQKASVAETFHYVEMCKSRVLVEMLAGRSTQARPSEHIPPHWLEQDYTLRQKLSELYRNTESNPIEIAKLESDLHQLRTRIRWQDAEYESFQTVTPLTLQEVQSRLPKEGCLLEYFTIDDEIFAFVITTASVALVLLPLRVSALTQAFKRIAHNRLGSLHHVVRHENNRLYTPWILHRLYLKLIEPLGEIVKQARTLYIVPHNLLHYVPFHALCDHGSKGLCYLNESEAGVRPIIYAPSATALFEYCQHKPISQQEGCLAMGYNGHILTMAETEAQTIVACFGGDSRCGEMATYETLLTEATKYRYIHLSCHGWFNPTWPMASSLMLADQAIDAFTVLRELRLNAELVCLSACETGQSHVMRGDELVGLTRAFLYAGTPSLIVSQWVVDELSTHLLMERFYQELRSLPITDGSINARALAQAQLYIKNLSLDSFRQILIEKLDDNQVVQHRLQFFADSIGLGSVNLLSGNECLLAHPYYWAPFFLVGERL